MNPYDAAFLALAPLAALSSLPLTKRWHLAAAISAVAFAGWSLAFASLDWANAKAAAGFAAIPNPTRAQMEAFSTDAATASAVFLFGLPVSLLYSLMWFSLVRLGRRLMRR